MNISWLTFRDLEYIVALGRHLHFAKAAAECHVSQPALSVQVKKFEDHLGVQVFERSNRRVHITEAGRAIVERAEQILEMGRKLSEGVQITGSPLTGTVSVGAIATLGPYLIPLILPRLRKSFPKATFVFREGLTHDLLKALKSGEVDFVLAADTFVDHSLRVERLFFEPFVLAVAKGHSLETKDPIGLRDLHPEEMVLLEDGHCLKDQALELCTRGKSMSPTQFQATSLETLRHLVAAGLGYTLFPLLAVKKEDGGMSKLITYRTLPKNAGREVVLVTRKEFSRPEDLAALIKFIREAKIV